MTERVVLAYSGGLDTSVAIGWIAEETGAEVIAVAVDVGQGGEDLDVIRKRALACGAVEAEVADAKDEFAEEYCLPAIKANALYMDRYPLVSALSRPTIVKHLVAAAQKHGATTVAHGCTGKGNDQVRFEAGIVALAPGLKCIAPVRDYAMTRDKAIAFCEAKQLPIATSKKSPYSIDQNVFGRAVETGFLEDIWNAPIEGCCRTPVQDFALQGRGIGQSARRGPESRSGMAGITPSDNGVARSTAGRAASQACGGHVRPTLTSRQRPVKQEPVVVLPSSADRNPLPSGRGGRQKRQVEQRCAGANWSTTGSSPRSSAPSTASSTRRTST